MDNTFSLVFIAAVGLMVSLRIWLSLRQIAHINGHRATVPEQFSDHIDLPSHQKAADYNIARARLGISFLFIETAFLLVMTSGGGLQTLHDFWHQKVSPPFYGLMMILSVLGISGLTELPLSIYARFVIEEKFGFNRMTLRLFITDLLKQTALGLVIGSPVILTVLWLMGEMGQLWWLYVWAFWCGLNLLILFIYPTWIAPLFNKFNPLKDDALKTRIDALLQRCGFSSAGLFVMDGSKRSSHGNAYFTGFGKNRRIVFFDTLLERLQAQETEAVLAHELGHYKHHHVLKRIGLLFSMSLIFLATLGELMTSSWFFNGLGVSAQDTALALILFFLAVPVFTFPLTPLMSMISRQHEFEADHFAARQVSADALRNALLKLYKDNAATLTPDPLHSLFYDAHPPAALRIARLN